METTTRSTMWKSFIFKDTHFWVFSECFSFEDVEWRRSLAEMIVKHSGKCFLWFNSFRRTKNCIPLYNPLLASFNDQEAVTWCKTSYTDLVNVSYVYDCIKAGKRLNIDNYKLRRSFNICQFTELNYNLERGINLTEPNRMPEEDNDEIVSVSQLSSYNESMSSCSNNDYISNPDYYFSRSTMDDIDRMLAIYGDANYHSASPKKLFDKIQFYLFMNMDAKQDFTFDLYGGDKNSCNIKEFVSLIKKNGGTIAESLCYNKYICCLCLVEPSDETVISFVMAYHRDLFLPAYLVNSSISGALENLNQYRISPSYCVNYDANCLSTSGPQKKMFSNILKRHTRICTSQTCTGIGKKCGYYREFYRTKKPKSLHPTKLTCLTHTRSKLYRKENEIIQVHKLYPTFLFLPTDNSEQLMPVQMSNNAMEQTPNAPKASVGQPAELNSNVERKNKIKGSQSYSFSNYINVILMEISKAKGFKEKFGSKQDFDCICNNVGPPLIGKGASVKTQFYRSVLPNIAKYKEYIVSLPEGDNLFEWFQAWSNKRN